ncbi:MAG: hypothetical protein ACTSX6_02185 [Candidatus Heimdallarchaeaceae archaeon]
MIHDQIRQILNEGAAGVMKCRAAKSSIALWQKRFARSNDPRMKLLAQKKIASFRMKVLKCKKRGMMI